MIANLLQTLLGAGLIYLLLAFIVIGLNEWIASTRASRGQFLKAGIKRLLPDQPIFRRVMQHPLISAMYRDQTILGRPPSYLAPASFAGAIIEIVFRRAHLAGLEAPDDPQLPHLKQAVRKIEVDHPLIAQSLRSVIDRADNYEQAYAAIEAWYSSSMERVGGWYARYTRRRIMMLALLLAVLGNIDAVQVVHGFWHRPAAIADTSGRTAATADPAWPVGYTCLVESGQPALRRLPACTTGFVSSLGTAGAWWSLLQSVLGWLITALLVALGAPYLFQVFRRS
jgi:hypothetical protein